MKQIPIQTAKPYTVTVGNGLLNSIGNTVRMLTKAQQVCIVTDNHVGPLYTEILQRSLADAKLQACLFHFSAGENSKNSETYLQLLNFLAQNSITRGDCIIALGGGVVGDLAGFAAATYLRGIPYIQVPTTLLAMVDSSVGGKTAIDLPAGKNLCGAFYQPTAVICDLDTLSTLPIAHFRDGCGEVIKYAVLFDPALFTRLEENGLDFDREAVISRCIEMKRDVVAADEWDTGRRMLLNLGHTFGHAIEKCSNYSVSHGQAVAIGMAMICRSQKCRDTEKILALLTKFGLPISTPLSAEALYNHALADKKRSADMVNLIVPNSIGDCAIVPTAVSRLKTLIEEGF